MVEWIASLLSAAALAAGTNSLPTSTTAPAPTAESAPGFSVTVAAPADAVEGAYRILLEKDDAAQEEIDRWIKEADVQGSAADAKALQKRIDERLGEVDRLYRGFLEKNPDHVNARIAFGSFLNDTGREGTALDQWQKALQLDPKNPAIHNNLAGIYGHRGPVTNAFAAYEKAIELSPSEPVYYSNFATTVFLFRRDVMEYYGITDEQKVFDKALDLYRKAFELDPHNFLVASDLAQTYYLVKPPRPDDALAAWNKAFPLAGDDLEREGVHVHLARVLITSGRLDEARTHLASVTNANYNEIKGRLQKMLTARESGTNAAPPAAKSP